MIEPNCDMPWEIYLDWLEDQGHGDLRFMESPCFVAGFDVACMYSYCGDGCGAAMGGHGQANWGSQNLPLGNSSGAGQATDEYFGDGSRVVLFNEITMRFDHTYGQGDGDG